MLTLESVNELTLKVTADAKGGVLYSKAGAFIGGESRGGKNYIFDKMLLGPGGSVARAALGSLMRRVTGENLPIMKVTSQGANCTYYANNAQHVLVLQLMPGEKLSVESESLLAWTEDLRYSVRFMAQGVLSQKGLATSVLEATGSNAQVAVLSDGNPIVLSNMDTGNVLTVDPDAMVAFLGDQNPDIDFDVSFKTLLGAGGRSGESYFFKFTQPTAVIIQPNERSSGVDLRMDGNGVRGR